MSIEPYGKRDLAVSEKMGNTAWRGGLVAGGVVGAAWLLPFISAPMLIVLLLVFGLVTKSW